MPMSTRTKSDELIARLGQSLAKPPATPLPDVEPEPVPGQRELATKISISLYADDLTHIDAIIAHMTQSRCRINRSEAIKLALRGVKLTPELSALHQEIKRDDGRRKGKEAP
jgi:hypothetical protein